MCTWGELIESISIGKKLPWPEVLVAQVISQLPHGVQEVGGPGQVAAACLSGPFISCGSCFVGVPSSGVIPMVQCWTSNQPGGRTQLWALPAHPSHHTWLVLQSQVFCNALWGSISISQVTLMVSCPSLGYDVSRHCELARSMCMWLGTSNENWKVL